MVGAAFGVKSRMIDRYMVKPGTTVRLARWNPAETRAIRGGKPEAARRLASLTRQLEELQELLYAERQRKVLVVLQAMDTGGKDGTIRHVFEGVGPQGVTVANFKAPTEEERARDFLWRIHHHVPARGTIAIFNRSHYEDVLVARVHGLVPARTWRGRYRHIRGFERMLADEGTTILKFFLYISRDEQKRRLQARLDDPAKHWKFDRRDLDERARWDEYVRAYEDAISATAAPWAPWFIVPADHKWYRNVVVSSILVETLRGLKMRVPEPAAPLDDVVIE